jgi:hypothetical protein
MAGFAGLLCLQSPLHFGRLRSLRLWNTVSSTTRRPGANQLRDPHPLAGQVEPQLAYRAAQVSRIGFPERLGVVGQQVGVELGPAVVIVGQRIQPLAYLRFQLDYALPCGGRRRPPCGTRQAIAANSNC